MAKAISTKTTVVVSMGVLLTIGAMLVAVPTAYAEKTCVGVCKNHHNEVDNSQDNDIDNSGQTIDNSADTDNSVDNSGQDNSVNTDNSVDNSGQTIDNTVNEGDTNTNTCSAFGGTGNNAVGGQCNF